MVDRVQISTPYATSAISPSQTYHCARRAFDGEACSFAMKQVQGDAGDFALHVEKRQTRPTAAAKEPMLGDRREVRAMQDEITIKLAGVRKSRGGCPLHYTDLSSGGPNDASPIHRDIIEVGASAWSFRPRRLCITKPPFRVAAGGRPCL